MTFSAALIRLALLACLAVFLLSFLPFVSSRHFAFASALLTFGLALNSFVPMSDGNGLIRAFHFGFGVFMSWMIFSVLYQSVLDCIFPASITMLYLQAALAYALILAVLAASLRRSDRLRRFSKICDPFHDG